MGTIPGPWAHHKNSIKKKQANKINTTRYEIKTRYRHDMTRIKCDINIKYEQYLNTKQKLNET